MKKTKKAKMTWLLSFHLYEKDKEGQNDMALILPPPRCFPSLSFSLPKVLTSPSSWLKNVRDALFVPPNGCHHLRGLFPKHNIIPKQIFPTCRFIEPPFLKSHCLQMLTHVYIFLPLLIVKLH